LATVLHAPLVPAAHPAYPAHAVAPSLDVEQTQEQEHNNKSDMWTCMSLIIEVLKAVDTATLGSLTYLENRLQWFGHILSEEPV
jgi:hypothetical protein